MFSDSRNAGSTARLTCSLKRLKSVLAYPYYQTIGYRPVRVSGREWDERFRSGEYSRLEDLSRIGGMSVIFGYCQFFSPASILDVGCGFGALVKYLKTLSYENYLGIDISPEAVSQATRSHSDGRTAFFFVADALTFVPARQFDMIIFNQSAYYFEKPQDVILRYMPFLSPSGRVIVSMIDSGRTRAAWYLILRYMVPVDSITILQAPGRNITKVLVPR